MTTKEIFVIVHKGTRNMLGRRAYTSLTTAEQVVKHVLRGFQHYDIVRYVEARDEEGGNGGY